ncbi:sigma-70 family RNA polymerase sigma factor [Parasalinivibrio latis]|uniref:sigma-70 family RNA polymerase sigma factor n=1 Tax=Parasalinivibrio latis TaxID=2952610 RepID=UPI0030DE6925
MTTALNQIVTHSEIGAAFAALQQSLRKYLGRKLPEAVDADDVIQDIFVKALLASESQRFIENLTGWLYSAARTAVADYYRCHRNVEPLPDDLQAEEADDALFTDVSTCLTPFIDTLPDKYRDTLKDVDINNRKMKELAEEESVSLSAVKSRAARARKMVKQQIQACCELEWQDGFVVDCQKNPSAITGSNNSGGCCGC